jgi:hypothetical protein
MRFWGSISQLAHIARKREAGLTGAQMKQICNCEALVNAVPPSSSQNSDQQRPSGNSFIPTTRKPFETRLLLAHGGRWTGCECMRHEFGTDSRDHGVNKVTETAFVNVFSSVSVVEGNNSRKLGL